MIAEALKMKNVLTAAVVFTSDPNEPVVGGAQLPRLSWPRFLQFPADSLLEGRKILVVDNLWYQGRTIMAVKGRIETAGGIPELAVIHWKRQNSRFPGDEPDYHAEITDAFVHYPWQRIDDSDYRVLAHPVLPLS
jgi:hypoxanthine phosphoribosyltransferase